MNTRQMPKEWTHELQHCIDNCQDCYRICAETLTYCLESGKRHHQAEHLKLLMDCMELCQIASNFMMRASDLHKHVCAACSAACDRCAESCESFEDDEVLMMCSDACQRAAESCKEVSGSKYATELRPHTH